MNAFDEILTQEELDELYEELKQEREAYLEEQRAGIDMLILSFDSDSQQFYVVYED